MSKKILIIEDSAASAEMIARELEKINGYEVSIANTGQEGIDAALKEKFDLIIIDIVLPDINGLTACKIIKEKLGAKSPKIITETGVIDAADAVAARKAGADDFCVKTSDMSQIIEAARRLISFPQ
jgi:DNA-binding response OmpR family regulator